MLSTIIRTITAINSFQYLSYRPQLSFLKSFEIICYCSRTSPSQNQMSLRRNHSNCVAVCQMTSTNNKNANFTKAKYLIESAASAGAKVVFLPEAFDFIGENKEETFQLADSLDGPLVKSFKDLAKSNNIWLSLGGMHVKRKDSPLLSNSHLMIDASGELVAIYNKAHLFDVDIPEKRLRLKESDMIEKGKEILPPVKTPVGNIGLAICYDLRFPELSLSQAAQGAQILTYPSAFTFATGSAHWELLLRARAVETQCFVVAAAQTGAHNKKRTSWGHAMVVDPSGTVIAQCSEGTGFALANIDLNLLKEVRETMPVWKHRRHDLYPSMASDPITLDLPPQDFFQFGQVRVTASQVFCRTALSFAFTNKCCVVPGHVLVAPLRPVERLHELSSVEVADLFQTVQRVEVVMSQVHDTTSTTVSVQDGPMAGQSIHHVHVHILPRRPGDFPENDDIYRKLQSHDKDGSDKKWRSEEEMTEEAETIKKYFNITKDNSSEK